MPTLTTSDGPIDFRYDSAAPAAVNARGSIGFRIDAGNVGTFQNIDGTGTGWRQFMIGGGTMTFGADTTWTLFDASATSLVIGATGDADMMTFSTVNAAEVIAIGAALGMRLNDTSPLRFGTPGTDLVLTPDGTNVVVTGTGILLFADTTKSGFGTALNDRFSIGYDNARLEISGADVVLGGAGAIPTRPIRVETGDRTLTDAGGSPASGALALATGQSLVSFAGGGATGGTSGAVTIQTGVSDVSAGANVGGPSGPLTVETGNANATAGTSGASGILTLRTGTSVSSTSGNVAISTGNVTGGAGGSGSVVLTTGTSAGGTRGTVQSIGRLTTTDAVVAGPTVCVVGGRASATTADSTPLVGDATATKTFDQTIIIPASTLTLAKTVRIWGSVRSTGLNAADAKTVLVRVGAQIYLTSSATAAANGDRLYFQLLLTARAAPAGVVAVAGIGTSQWTTAAAASTPGGALPNLATDGPLTVDVQITMVNNGANTAVLEQLVADYV